MSELNIDVICANGAAMDCVTDMGTDGTGYGERATRAGYVGMTVGAAFGATMSDADASVLVDSILTLGLNCATLFDPLTTDVGVGMAPMDVGADGTTRYYEIVGGR